MTLILNEVAALRKENAVISDVVVGGTMPPIQPNQSCQERLRALRNGKRFADNQVSFLREGGSPAEAHRAAGESLQVSAAAKAAKKAEAQEVKEKKKAKAQAAKEKKKAEAQAAKEKKKADKAAEKVKGTAGMVDGDAGDID